MDDDKLRADNWTRCPSTHCERRQECASPNDCSGTGRGSMIRGLERTFEGVNAHVVLEALKQGRRA